MAETIPEAELPHVNPRGPLIVDLFQPPDKKTIHLPASACLLSRDFSELLESGNFADATIHCLDRSWRVHKTVICHRSAWFAKCLSGSFSEAKSSEVTIHNFNPEHVDWLIQYLYSGGVEFLRPRLEDAAQVHAACVELHRLGDFFDLKGLTETAKTALRDHHTHIALKFQICYAEEERLAFADSALEAAKYCPRRPRLPELYKDEFFKHAKTAYGNESITWESLRAEFVWLFQSTRYLLLTDSDIHDRLEEVPRLAFDVMRANWLEDRDMASLPVHCLRCQKDPLALGKKSRPFLHTFMAKKDAQTSPTHNGFCQACVKKLE